MQEAFPKKVEMCYNVNKEWQGRAFVLFCGSFVTRHSKVFYNAFVQWRKAFIVLMCGNAELL